MIRNILILTLILVNCFGFVKAGQNYYTSEGQIKIAAIKPGEDWVKIVNVGETPVDLAGWVLYDGDDKHELFINLSNISGVSSGNENREDTMIYPEEELFINGKNDSDFRLKNAGGEVRIFSGPIEISGELQDKITYPEVKEGETYVINKSENHYLPNESDKSKSSEETYLLENRKKTNDNEVQYHTPENKEFSTEENPDRDSDKSNNKKENKVISSNKNKASSSQDITENINAKNKESQNQMTFTASTKMEKTPNNLLYRLWSNWFLRRIILPLLGLWVILYGFTHFVKKRLED